MPTLYLVRHGETEHNLNHIIQGQIDSPLTELGKTQAEQTSNELKDIPFSACYYSPLGRTTKTAEIILKHHNIPAYADRNLMEFDMGVLEGEVNDHTLHGLEFKNFAIAPHKYITPVKNGETYESLTERVYNCCYNISNAHSDDEKILIVSHGGPLRSLLNPLINKPRSEFWLAPDVTPASVSIIKWHKGSELKLVTFAGTPKEAIEFDNSQQLNMVRPN